MSEERGVFHWVLLHQVLQHQQQRCVWNREYYWEHPSTAMLSSVTITGNITECTSYYHELFGDGNIIATTPMASTGGAVLFKYQSLAGGPTAGRGGVQNVPFLSYSAFPYVLSYLSF